MLTGNGYNLVQHVGHGLLLMPLIALIPAFASLESFYVRISWMSFIPGCLCVRAVAEGFSTPLMINVKLNRKNIQEQLIDFVSRKQLTHHAQNILTIRAIKAGNKPAPAFFFASGIDPAPVGM